VTEGENGNGSSAGRPDGMVTAVLTVNGEAYPVVFPAHHTLLEVLREECGLPGTKHGCELGECGACAVLVDGEPVLSCLQITSDVIGKSIETVEGLQDGNNLSPLQEAFADLGAAQCGYCTPGILMVAEALLEREPQPNGEQIAAALSGNICRCTGYQRIIEAVKWAAAKRRGDDWRPAEEFFTGNKVPGGNTP
jgi:aerobic-type carbon monoxide dehydrogenase small subunit (CoxS/CutS family)